MAGRQVRIELFVLGGRQREGFVWLEGFDETETSWEAVVLPLDGVSRCNYLILRLFCCILVFFVFSTACLGLVYFEDLPGATTRAALAL